MDYTINKENAKRSLIIMNNFFQENKDLKTANIILPSSIKQGSVEHFKYLFYSCMLNYGMKSKVLHENLKLLYEENPCLFNPEYVLDVYEHNMCALADLLRSKIHVRYPNQSAKNWINLSKIILTKYNGNFNEIFINKQTYLEYQDAIFQLDGFGQKTGGLLLRMLIDEGFIKPLDGIAEIPIDRHDIDLCIWLEVINGITAEDIKKSKEVIGKLSKIWVNVSNDLNISPSITDQYLWIIGSKFCSKTQCNICPLNSLCINKAAKNNPCHHALDDL